MDKSQFKAMITREELDEYTRRLSGPCMHDPKDLNGGAEYLAWLSRTKYNNIYTNKYTAILDRVMFQSPGPSIALNNRTRMLLCQS